MEGQLTGQLPTRQCPTYADKQLYEASLQCPHCNTQWEPCIITGYPLIKGQSIRTQFSNMGALRDYWNDFVSVTQRDPWTNNMATPV